GACARYVRARGRQIHHSAAPADSADSGIPQRRYLHEASRTDAGPPGSCRRNGMNPLPRLYAIADASFGDPVALPQKLFAGGRRLVQVRNKKGSSRDLLEQVERILSIAPGDAQVLVNDRVDVALLSGAAGVHLGQTDLSPAAARRILGP